MKKEIIETAVSISTGLISKCRSTDNQEDKTGNAPEYSGLYIHNVSGAVKDKWIPAVAVCDHFGITLEELRHQLQRSEAQESAQDLDELKEFTPVSVTQIWTLAEVMNQRKGTKL